MLYFDCFSGISGDMVLGAFLDAGLPLDDLTQALGRLVPEAEIRASRVLRSGIAATKFDVHTHEHHHEHAARHEHHEHPGHPGHHEHPEHPEPHEHPAPHRSLPEIFALIDASGLSTAGRTRAKTMFERLAAAEAEMGSSRVDLQACKLEYSIVSPK